MRPTTRWVLAVVALGATAACGGGDSGGGEAAGVRPGTYLGKVAGTDAYIALIADGDELRGGYLCDSKDISTWLKSAAVDGDEAALASRTDDPVGSATWSGTKVSGTVQVGGANHDFTATLATGDAGLYRKATGTFGEAGFEETGWIVLGDGSLRGRTGFIDANLKTGTKAAPSSVSGDLLDTGFIDAVVGFSRGGGPATTPRARFRYGPLAFVSTGRTSRRTTRTEPVSQAAREPGDTVPWTVHTRQGWGRQR